MVICEVLYFFSIYGNVMVMKNASKLRLLPHPYHTYGNNGIKMLRKNDYHNGTYYHDYNWCMVMAW